MSRTNAARKLEGARKIDLASLSIAALIQAFAGALVAALADPAAIRLEHWGAWTVYRGNADRTLVTPEAAGRFA